MNADFNSEVMLDMSRGSRTNIFTLKDHAIVREGVSKLQGYEHTIVVLRFWEKNTISEIATILDLSWQDVEYNLSQALSKLQQYCLENQSFSRKEPSERSVWGKQKLLSEHLNSLDKAG